MLGVEWPDSIPALMAEQLGNQRLRDTVNPEVPSHVRQEARQLAEEGVSQIKKEIFFHHGLPGTA
jgi:hypothetical protein